MPRLDTDEAAPPAATEAGAVDQEAPIAGEETTGLPHGDALTLEEAAGLTAERRHQIVVILGERRAGKTTLLAELHQAFLKGPFGNFIFAGSETIQAYERRCALGRTTSRQAIPAMPRTQLTDGVRLLHLAVREVTPPGRTHNVLFTDVSGELSKNARRSSADAQELAPIVKHADRITVVVDGKKIASPTLRQRVRTDTKTLLRALAEAGGMHSRSQLDLVVNKWDWVSGSEALRKFAEDLLEECALSVRANVARVETHRVAARPHNNLTERWLGMNRLLSRWSEPDPVLELAVPPDESYARAFLNYGYRNG